MKYNFLTWWLSVSIKPLVYRIWKGLITTIVFLLWVMFIAVYPDLYWKFSLYVILPVFLIDLVWDYLNYYLLYKNK